MASRSAASLDEKRAKRLGDARHALEAELRGNLTESEWKFFVEKSYAEEYLGGILTLAEFAKNVRHHRDAFRRRRDRQSSPLAQRRSGTGREADVAELAAARVTRDFPVEAFRRAHLHRRGSRGLLPPGEQVYAWLEKQSESEGRHTEWLRIKLPRGHKWKSLPGSAGYGIVPTPPIVLGEGKASADELFELTMSVPDRDGSTELRIAEGGVLDELHLLATRIARDVGWTEAEAVEFVLTGRPPAVTLVDTQVRDGNRLTLSVHPSITPRELAAAYSAVRRERGLGARNLTPKHMALAAFSEARPGGETWAARLKAWNASLPKEHHEWRYAATAVTNFARDAAQARRRMEERSGTTRER